MENKHMDQIPDNGFSELWLHYIWRENKLNDIRLSTYDHKDLTIIFPGWYNRGWGPDFTEARIRIDGIEYFGDVEIHIVESSWMSHHHDQDPAYNKVVLHVFFKKDPKNAVNQFGHSIPSLHLGKPALETFWQRQDIQGPVLMKELPGACGLYLTKKRYRKIQNLIFQAAEQRLLLKAADMSKELKNADHESQEDFLFKSICRSAGYTAYSESFTELAQIYPYSQMIKLFRSMHRQSRIEVLGRWLGFMGILDTVKPSDVHDTLRREWLAFQQFWSTIKDTMSALKPLPKRPFRPLNHPLRRLTGLYYHLEKVQFQGLVKSWLKFIHDCRKVIAEKRHVQTSILTLLDQMFPQPEWDPLNYMLFATSTQQSENSMRLIGKQRQLIILINSIIPFFLIWSRSKQDRELERGLFDLFLLLPNEGKNSKTRFLEQRLFSLNPEFKIKKNLSYHQGLIQLHDDCCKSYYEGCWNCSLVKLMQKPDE
ncbi:MAG: DUF2851 family protein [SAR324 cluster bacterium]|nr:DUF2851 family protein [SAR324 cluster bacterium]